MSQISIDRNHRIKHFKKVREQPGLVNVLTLDVTIIFKRNDGNPKAYCSWFLHSL